MRKFKSDLTLIAYDKGLISFKGGVYETDKKDEIEVLTGHGAVTEITEETGTETEKVTKRSRK